MICFNFCNACIRLSFTVDTDKPKYRAILLSLHSAKYDNSKISLCWAANRTVLSRYAALRQNVFFYRKRGHCVQYIAILGYQTVKNALVKV